MITIDNIDDLKFFASLYVEASDIELKDKVLFIEFIKKANKDQVYYLLCKGYMKSDKDILSEGFETLFLYAFKSLWKNNPSAVVKTGAVIGAPYAAIVAASVYAATKIYKAYLSKAARACSVKKGEAKRLCINTFKINALKEKVMNLKK